MATVADELPRGDETTAQRILRVLGKAPIHIAARRDRRAVARADARASSSPRSSRRRASTRRAGGRSSRSRASRRWTTTTRSSTRTRSRLALWTTVLVSLGGTILPIFIAAMAAYAFAWLDFPGRDWLFIGVIAMLVVPIQMALIPIFKLYSDLNLFDTVIGLILFHTAFGLPFAIFLLRNFFIGIPRDLMEAARIDGASEIRIFLRLMLPLGAAGDRIARDLPVPLDVERPARRAHVRARHAADHRRDLHAAAPVRLEHRTDRPGGVRLADDPARRLLRLPAVFRPGPARRLG